MRKIRYFLFVVITMFFLCCRVNAESLDISLINDNKNLYEFDVLVKDVKNEKTNVISGHITYDKKLFSKFELVEVDGWKLYKKVNDNKICFVLVNVNNYAIESMNVLDFKVSFSGKNTFNINFDSIESSSSSSIIRISDVDFKYEIPKNEMLPGDDLINNIESDDSGSGEDVSNTTEGKDEETKEEKEDLIEEKDDKKGNRKSFSEMSYLFVIILIVIALIILLFILFKNKDKKGGK